MSPRAKLGHAVFIILLSVTLAISLSSCGWVKKTHVKSAVDEAHHEYSLGDFQKALDTYQSTYKRYPKDSEVLKNYIEAIESMKAQADKSFDKENFVQAHITYAPLLKSFSRFSDFANLLSFKEEFLVARLKMSRIQQAKKQAEPFLKDKDFQKGIDVYRALFQQYSSDKMVRNRYISLLESIKRHADDDFEYKDFSSAGRTYRTLLRNYLSFSQFRHLLSYNARSLDTGIETCRKMLFEEGLKHYRSGNLSQAISIRRDILTFDPENLEVRKAADMEIIQTGNLKKISSDGSR